MLILNRRDFLKNATAFGALAATGIARGASDEVGKPYPGWKPGEMDIHFVYTGCGENMFCRLPDGTAILNDTGDFFRTRDRGQVPLLPSLDRLGGEGRLRAQGRRGTSGERGGDFFASALIFEAVAEFVV